MNALSPEKALVFRITHIANVPWILANGVHCQRSATQDPNFVEIGNPDLIGKRERWAVPVRPGGGLSDYVLADALQYQDRLEWTSEARVDR